MLSCRTTMIQNTILENNAIIRTKLLYKLTNMVYTYLIRAREKP